MAVSPDASGDFGIHGFPMLGSCPIGISASMPQRGRGRIELRTQRGAKNGRGDGAAQVRGFGKMVECVQKSSRRAKNLQDCRTWPVKALERRQLRHSSIRIRINQNRTVARIAILDASMTAATQVGCTVGKASRKSSMGSPPSKGSIKF